MGKLFGELLFLFLYMLCYSWVIVVCNYDVLIVVISVGMGYSSERIMFIYLDFLDNVVIDNVNEKILKGLNDIIFM